MTVLIVAPVKAPEVREIEGTLESMQAVVGGYIEAVYPFEDSSIALVANEEGKLNSLPLNRCIRDGDGSIADIIAGTFFLCGAPADSDSFVSLTEGQIKTYKVQFSVPEVFLNLGEKLLVLPYLDEIAIRG